MKGMVVVFLAIAASVVAFSGVAQAVLIWDTDPNDGAGITDGNGGWINDPTGWFGTPWNNGTGNVGWDSNFPDVAQFGVVPSTTSYVIDVDASGVVANGLAFSSPYTFQGGSITLAGDAPTITVPSAAMNIEPKIYSLITSSAATLRISGYATSSNYSIVHLYGANSYTGTLEVTDGGFAYAYTGALSTMSTGTIVGDNCTFGIMNAGTFDLADLHLSGFGAGGYDATNPAPHRGAIRFSQTDGTVTWAGDIVLDADAAICQAQSAAGREVTISGAISGDHQMIKTGPGELILTNENTYTGGTRIYRGYLTLACETGYAISGDVDYRGCYNGSNKGLLFAHGDEDGMPQIEPTAVIYFDPTVGGQYFEPRGHTVTVGGISNLSSTSNNTTAIQNNLTNTNGTLIVDNAADHTYRGIIRDKQSSTAAPSTLAIIKRGVGTLTLDGRAHEFTGGLSVEEGTLVYGANTERKSQASPSVVVKAGATLDVSAVTGYAVSNTYTPDDPANPGTKLQQVLSGNGTVAGNLLVGTGGALAPGESVGQMTFNGALDMATDGLFKWELGALSTATPGVDFDSLLVNGNLTLGGTSQLALDFTAVGNPDAGVAFWTANHSWKIIDVESGGATAGAFGSIVNGTFDVGGFATALDAGGDVLLKYIVGGVTYPPGDANRDGKVDATDAALLAANWLKASGAIWDEGDFNDDHAVDDLDLAILAANWGTGTSSAAVPEPSALALVVLGLVGALAMAVRRRRQ